MWARSLSLDMALIPLSLEQQLPGPSSLPPPTKRTATSDCLKSIFRTLFSGHPLPELWNADSGILLSHNCWSQGSGSWTCHWRPMRLRIPNGLEFLFFASVAGCWFLCIGAWHTWTTGNAAAVGRETPKPFNASASERLKGWPTLARSCRWSPSHVVAGPRTEDP